MKLIRENLNLTQEKMAEILEITPRYLAQIESGQKNMSTMTLYTACEKLSLSADYLFMGRTDNENNTYTITDMLKNPDEEYLPLAEDMLKTFILAVNKSKDN